MGIVNYGSGHVVGFISENSIDRFKLNKDATFIPFDGQHNIVQLTATSIDKSAIQNLSYLTLSSNYGGPIAVRSYVSGNFKNRPEEAFYRANFKPLNKENLIKWEIPGYVHIDGHRYSPFLQFIKNLLALLIREIDF
jgi:putative peptide zinc metalloprotease protein